MLACKRKATRDTFYMHTKQLDSIECRHLRLVITRVEKSSKRSRAWCCGITFMLRTVVGFLGGSQGRVLHSACSPKDPTYPLAIYRSHTHIPKCTCSFLFRVYAGRKVIRSCSAMKCFPLQRNRIFAFRSFPLRLQNTHHHHHAFAEVNKILLCIYRVTNYIAPSISNFRLVLFAIECPGL